ncbi:MAG: hypothetical protein KGJ82_07965 [Nitrospirota bacterium]|nr:hypothetical protein [Nitrospirota bacterium]
MCLDKIMQASRAGTLKSHKNLMHILHYWNGVGGAESDVRPWVSQLIIEMDGLVIFLRGMSSKVTTDKEQFLRTNIESAKNLVSLEELEERIGSRLKAPVGEKDEVLLKAWAEALSYRKAPHGQGDFRGDVDFREI